MKLPKFFQSGKDREMSDEQEYPTENGEEKERLADVVDVENITFARQTKIQTQKAVVLYTPSQGVLRFNAKMTELLNMRTWQQVVVGFDEQTGIIVLKQADAEEYGAVLVRTTPQKHIDEAKTPDMKRKRMDRRTITIAHLLRGHKIKYFTEYRAERDGTMIFLKGIEGAEEEVK
jgi:hypothetical protein